MSTKIYNAYEVTGLKNTRIETVMEYAQSIMSEIRPHTMKLYKEEISSELIQLIDNYKSNNDIPTSMPDFFDETYKARWEHSYIGELAFFPRKGKLYMIHYFYDNIWKIIDEKKYGLVDFHYQNSSDKPDYISNYEWNKRRKIWAEFFNKGVPAQQAFCVQSFTKYDMPYGGYDNIITYQPTLKERINGLCKNKEIEIIFNKMKEDEQYNDLEDYQIGVRASLQVMWDKTDCYSKHKHLYEGILPEKYTVEDLRDFRNLVEENKKNTVDKV